MSKNWFMRLIFGPDPAEDSNYNPDTHDFNFPPDWHEVNLDGQARDIDAGETKVCYGTGNQLIPDIWSRKPGLGGASICDLRRNRKRR